MTQLFAGPRRKMMMIMIMMMMMILMMVRRVAPFASRPALNETMHDMVKSLESSGASGRLRFKSPRV